MSSLPRSASFANPPAPPEEGMPRMSDAASEFGRRLTLAAESDMPVRTRNQARNEERQQASGSARQSTGQASRQSGVTAGPSRSARTPAAASTRASRRESGRGRTAANDDDDDEEDSDDDDDDGGDSDDDDGIPRSRFAETLAVFEPNNLVYHELMQSEARLEESSQAFRNILIQLERLPKDPRWMRDFEKILPLEGRFWGEQTVRKLNKRYETIFQDLAARTRDVIDTTREIKSFYTAVENIFRNYKGLEETCYNRLASLLRVTLAQIIVNWDRDIPAPTSYVSGQEYNLYFRFASNKDWQHCLSVIRQIQSLGFGQHFRAGTEVQAWQDLYRQLSAKYPQGQFPNANVRDFGFTLRSTMVGLRIPL